MSLISTQRNCRSCGRRLTSTVLNLGKLYVVGFGDKKPVRAPLTLTMCPKCSLLQLRHTVNQEMLFRRYYYKSGVNQTMRDHLTGIVREVEKRVRLKERDIVLDIGANDGTLLRAYRKSLTRVGFEPAENLVDEAKEGGNFIVNEFFNAADFKQVAKGRKAKVITAISMFYDLAEPNRFLENIAEVLDDDGLFVIQQNYLPAMLDKNAFDNVVHEHLEYYSMLSLSHLLKQNHLSIVDVEFNDLNGGSFRTYAQKEEATGRRVVSKSVSEALSREDALELATLTPYLQFARRIKTIRKSIRGFVVAAVKRRKRVYVYGASTRGNTLLQIVGLDCKTILRAVERNPEKWGTLTTGTNIPVISEDEARADPPDYLLILPWHFLGEFVTREWRFLMQGGRFIVPLPEPCVLEATRIKQSR